MPPTIQSAIRSIQIGFPGNYRCVADFAGVTDVRIRALRMSGPFALVPSQRAVTSHNVTTLALLKATNISVVLSITKTRPNVGDASWPPAVLIDNAD
eukprot:6193284-Pleurochrysis_carterae.AAC.1